MDIKLCVISTDTYWLLLASNSSAEKNQLPKQNTTEVVAPWAHMNKHHWFVGSWWVSPSVQMSWNQMYLLRKRSGSSNAGNWGLPLASSLWRLHSQICLWKLFHSHIFPLILEGTEEFSILAYDFWVDAPASCDVQDYTVRPPAARCH